MDMSAFEGGDPQPSSDPRQLRQVSQYTAYAAGVDVMKSEGGMKEDRTDDGPTLFGFLLKLPKDAVSEVASAVKTVFYRVVYPDLERERKQIQVDREKEGLKQESLATFDKALDIEKKISDPELRERFLQNLRSSIGDNRGTSRERVLLHGPEWASPDQCAVVGDVKPVKCGTNEP